MFSALPNGEKKRMLPGMKAVELSRGEALWEPGKPSQLLYFPTTSLISLEYESDAGGSISVAMLGRNSIVGLDQVRGVGTIRDRAVVRIAGTAFTMPLETAKDEVENCGQFESLLAAYSQIMVGRIGQIAVCNRLHSIDRQLNRLLLVISDEIGTKEIRITHDILSGMLGVRRESVSLAIGRAQKQGLLKTSRGRLVLADIDKLRKSACECFQVIKELSEQCVAKYSRDNPE